MPTQSEALAAISELATVTDDVEVLWLYGSRARGTASASSDYDLAVAFSHYIENPIERRLRPELLALQWRKHLGVDLSIVDINSAPVTLSYTVIQDNHLLYSQSDFRQMVEEQRVMSKWELDHLYHRKHYA